MTDKEIREKLIEKAIPSKYMREFYRSINRDFTDYELAAMLWNSCMKRTAILRAIKELSESTADRRLRQQIENRLRYEDEKWPCGFFKALDMAIAYAKKDGKRKFSIKNQPWPSVTIVSKKGTEGGTASEDMGVCQYCELHGTRGVFSGFFPVRIRKENQRG